MNDNVESEMITIGGEPVRHHIENNSGAQFNENEPQSNINTMTDEEIRQYLSSLSPEQLEDLYQVAQISANEKHGRKGRKHSLDFQKLLNARNQKYSNPFEGDEDRYNDLGDSTFQIGYRPVSIKKGDKYSAKSFGDIAKAQRYSLPRDPATKYDSEMYDDLINLILNAKKDIKLAHAAETREGAEKWGKSRGLRLGPKGQDINHDGIEDVVLYNKAGKPVVINGYHLVPSRFPLRQMYYNQAPTKADRAAIDGFKGFTNLIWHADPDFDIDGKRTVEYDNTHLPPELKGMKARGYRIPPAPKSEMSYHQRFINVLSQVLKNATNPANTNSPVINAVQGKSWVLKAFNKLQLFTITIIFCVDGMLLTDNVCNLGQDLMTLCADYKVSDDETAWLYYTKLKAKAKNMLKNFYDEMSNENITNGQRCLKALGGGYKDYNPLLSILERSFLAKVNTSFANQIPTDADFYNLPKPEQLRLRENFAGAMAESLRRLRAVIIHQILGKVARLSQGLDETKTIVVPEVIDVEKDSLEN